MKKLILSILITTMLSPVFEAQANVSQLSEIITPVFNQRPPQRPQGSGSSRDDRRTRVRIRGRR